MRHTNRQTTTRTLTDLFRALDRRYPVTITYLKEEKDQAGKCTGNRTETIRTIETIDVLTTAAGNIIVRAMDRETREARSFSLRWITAYTLHRSAYRVERPEPEDTTETPAIETVDDLIAWEIARDPRDADYYSDRHTLAV